MQRGWQKLAVVVCSGVLGLAACAGGGAGVPDGGGTQEPARAAAVITLQNFTFSPANLDVSPGQRVTVRNLDPAPHSVTSQSAPGQFRPGAVAGVSFDTGIIGGGAEASFTLPANAPAGTVVPYFCVVHTSGMRNAGQLTIR